MENKSLLWLALFAAMVAGTACAASAIDYFTYRMNFPPGESRYHEQQINFTGNLTITLPAGFTFVSSTLNYTTSGSNYIWQANGTATLNYTIQSPGTCTEGDVYKSGIYNNGTFIDDFVYVCINDTKIVDYKVEFGHGCGNYLSQNEPYIPNETSTLFNLVRVWNIGNYLDPDEDAYNANIVCYYEDYPVRTYGRVEVGYEDSGINGSFLWDKIYGGYWFRIGVLSQDVSGKSVGDLYSVNCTELTYDFSHQRVVASFPNYSLEARSTEPLSRNATVYGAKEVITLTNSEEYPIYDLILNFVVDGYIETNRLARLGPGETVTFYADTGSNVTVDFIPSWERHCFSPTYYTQVLTNVTAAVNNPPVSTDIPSQAWVQNTSNDNAFDLDNYFSDPENDTLTYTYSGPVNINATINPATNEVSFSQPSNFTGIEYVVFCADDGNSTTCSNNVTLVVYPSNATGNVTTVTKTVYKGGGGSRKVYIYVPVNVTEELPVGACREMWYCEEWSKCLPEGFMNRTCIDINDCGTTFFKPPVKIGCEYIPPFEEMPVEPEIEKPEPVCELCLIIPLVLTLLFILLVILIFTEKKNKKQKNEVHKKWQKEKLLE